MILAVAAVGCLAFSCAEEAVPTIVPYEEPLNIEDFDFEEDYTDGEEEPEIKPTKV